VTGYVDPLADDEAPDPLMVALMATSAGYDALDRLADFLRRPAWHARAACAGLGPAIFYPEGRGSNPRAGLEVCARCEVVAECAASGRTEAHGTWGGRSEAQRRQIRSSGRLRPPAA
jgi:hypothetical protein